MNSSISSSEAGGGEARRWRAFSWVFAIAAAASLTVFAGAVLALDPYDTGRHGLFGRVGPEPGGAWRANVSRAADPAFNAAVIGNSRIQMLQPWTLDELTGLRFVNLAVPGSSPVQMRLVAHTFLRSHPQPAALVMNVDDWWCEPRLIQRGEFPDWLYASDPLSYYAGLMRWQSLEMAPRRIERLMGKGERARADGYDDYTAHYSRLTGAETAQQRMREATGLWETNNPDHHFPSVALLADLLDAIPAETPVALVWPPTHLSLQPQAGSPAARNEAMCRKAVSDVARRRGRVVIVDWGGDRPVNRDPLNFHDAGHYVRDVADKLSHDVGSALARLMEQDDAQSGARRPTPVGDGRGS